jgi:hypothetical protein
MAQYGLPTLDRTERNLGLFGPFSRGAVNKLLLPEGFVPHFGAKLSALRVDMVGRFGELVALNG